MGNPRLVRATEACFVGERLRSAGEVFEYDGPMPPKGGALVDMEESIAEPPKPRRERKPSKRGVPAPSWSGEGNKELGGQVEGE